MKNIRLKAKLGHQCSVGECLNALSDIICRTSIKFADDGLEVLNVDEKQISDIIDIIDEYYVISDVEILNCVTTNSVTFKNKVIEVYLNKLLRTISWSVNCRGASADDIKAYILSTIESISMKYDPIQNYECSVGDIITVSYCNNPRGEVSGGYVHCIVCDISDDEIIYVIPIAKNETNGTFSRWHINFFAPNDVTYFVDGYEGGVALLEKSGYISRQRIKKEAIAVQPVGNVSPEFLNELLELLPKVFSFRKQATVKEDNSKAIDEPAINQESSKPKENYNRGFLYETL